MAQTTKNVKRSKAFWKIKSIIKSCETLAQVKSAQTLLLRFTGLKGEQERLEEIANEMHDKLNPYLTQPSAHEEHETEIHRRQMFKP